MNELIKKEIISQIDELPAIYKYDVALLMMSAIYEKIPEWKVQQQQEHMQMLENLYDFLEGIMPEDE